MLSWGTRTTVSLLESFLHCPQKILGFFDGEFAFVITKSFMQMQQMLMGFCECKVTVLLEAYNLRQT